MNQSDQKIVPHLWFDKQAKEAAEFYVSLFGNGSTIGNITTLTGTPSGDCDVISFDLWGHKFMAISAGPFFELNPSVSFFINFDPSRIDNARNVLDAMWEELSKEGTPLMPLDRYPWSERYGWIEDKYGVTWQLMLTDPAGEPRPAIVPSLMFVGDLCGQAEEATDFYLSVFKNSERGLIARYPAGMEPDKEGTIMFTDFKLLGVWFAAMDSAGGHKFFFNEAISLVVYCDDQEEIDYYWSMLSAVPEAEQCGWIKDKYGLSWQIIPRALDDIMRNGTAEQINRVTETFLKMKKFDVKELTKVY